MTTENETAPMAASPPAFDILALFSEVKERLGKVEADNAGMRAELEAAKSRGDVALNLEQIRHVMTKYFPHDMPDVEPVAPPVPKFNPFTGAALN